tara:strand:+ start:164 stop:556 length:393 start_codon:yes stop_codon:yes gene_type:complete
MSVEFKLDIVNPDQSYYSNDKAKEVIVPAFEGEMGILRDHISIISFLKPGIIKIYADDTEENFYVDDGILEFKDNTLSILTSSIFDLKDTDKSIISNRINDAEKELIDKELNDQNRFLISQKIEVLKNIS